MMGRSLPWLGRAVETAGPSDHAGGRSFWCIVLDIGWSCIAVSIVVRSFHDGLHGFLHDQKYLLQQPSKERCFADKGFICQVGYGARGQEKGK